MPSHPRFRGPASRRAPSVGGIRPRSSETTRGEVYSLFRISARLSLQSPAYRFSHAHPELRIEILGRMDVDTEHQVVEARVLSREASQYADELRSLPGFSEVDVHSETDHSAVYRLSLRSDLAAQAIRRHRVLTRYPMVLQDGWLRFETVAPAGRIRRLLGYLGGFVGPTRIEAVRRGPLKSGELGLTDPQEALFRAALRAGYFNAPRGVSLTELARRLGRSKSTVSHQLTKIQQRLAESALRLELQAFPIGVE